MKKILFIYMLFLLQLSLNSQPSEFSWTNRHYTTNIDNKFNYISSPKDQKQQGTCNIFASVSAVEAMVQIYFNKNCASLDLSESYIYSKCIPRLAGCVPAGLTASLDFFKSDGVIDDATLPFPTSPNEGSNPPCYYRDSCYTGTADYRVKIPGYHQITPWNSDSLKRVIIYHGPLIASLDPDFSGVYHGDPGTPHTVLIVGWKAGASNIMWQVKDSWPGDSSLLYHEFDIFEYGPTFYYIIPDTLGVEINCTGDECDIFDNRFYDDFDLDGFYNWGIGPKPSSLTSGPNKIDYNDDDPNVISLTEHYNPASPTITCLNDHICSSGATFEIDSLPSGFTVSWSVSPSNYFDDSTSGTGATAFITPKAEEIMKTCYITFTIHETGTSWTKQYSKTFIINGPDPSEISTSVEDSYGHTPPKISGIWFLCPNSTYYIYLNNNGNCPTSDYSWTTPQAWTQYYSYSNYVSVNTGSQPWGTVEVYAKTCCNTTSSVKIKTQYFSEDNCGEYLVVYPNPASNSFTILFKDNFDLNANDKSLEIFDLNFNSKYKLNEFFKENTINTASWKAGYYYIRLRYNGRDFSYKVRISH